MAAVMVAGAVAPARASSIRPSQVSPRVVARPAFVKAGARSSMARTSRIMAGEASAGTTAGRSFEQLLRRFVAKHLGMSVIWDTFLYFSYIA